MWTWPQRWSTTPSCRSCSRRAPACWLRRTSCRSPSCLCCAVKRNAPTAPWRWGRFSSRQPTAGTYNSHVRILVQLAILVGAFAAGALLAELFGAVNLGTALGIGQITFALALVYVLLRG